MSAISYAEIGRHDVKGRAVWALRGVIQSERTDPAHHGHELWRRHRGRSCGVSGVRRVDDYSAQLFSTKPEMSGLSRTARRRGRWPHTRRQRKCRCFAS